MALIDYSFEITAFVTMLLYVIYGTENISDA